MALRSLFRRLSLSALSRRWMKRFGTSLRKRFLRQQDVHRTHMQMERLEDRSLLATLTWVAPGADNNWSTAGNWSSTDPSGHPTPKSNDTIVFNSANAGGSGFFSPNNDLSISSVTGLFIQI